MIVAFSTLDTGQFAFAPSASSLNVAASSPAPWPATPNAPPRSASPRHLLHGQGRVGVQAFRRMARAAELERGRHAEAAGMRGGDQFFRVGALAVAEPGIEAIGRILQRAALRGQTAGAVLATASPARRCVTLDACHACSPPWVAALGAA